MKTSLGIWALSTMVTRFVPGGYQPQWAGENTPARVRRAVEGLGDLIDGYEFHYRRKLNEQNVDQIARRSGPTTTSTAWPAACTSIRGSGAADSATPIRPCATRP